jgi:AmmeMemoRadiSam system protein B
MWLLRDPLELTEYQLVLAPPLAQILVYCDGTRGPLELQAALSEEFGIPVDLDIVKDTLEQLDDAYLLDNERSRKAKNALLEGYRNQTTREPSLAGVGYPADPDELTTQLTSFGQGDDLSDWSPWSGRGIISPHIDYHRGGPVYSQIWRRAEQAVKQAELVLILGTDHNGSYGGLTLTTKPYSTPYGVIPTDLDLVHNLAAAIGPDAFSEELHHRNEHSIELSAVWYHFMSDGNPCPMVPILCGSFQHLIEEDHQPEHDPKLVNFIEALRELTSGKRVLAIASVDLAHLGPSFGDDFVMDSTRREEVFQSDLRLIETISVGDSTRFFQEVATVEDQNRICGFSSIYILLQYLGPTTGIQVAYEQCSADQNDTSLVSICGVLLE